MVLENLLPIDIPFLKTSVLIGFDPPNVIQKNDTDFTEDGESVMFCPHCNST